VVVETEIKEKPLKNVEKEKIKQVREKRKRKEERKKIK